ncbi:Glutamine-dependent NAD(+) synthetase [Azospirillaceae bacterium]
MTDRFSLALAQINPKVGDISGNVERIRAARSLAAEAGADLVLFSELVVVGYPPEDLVLRRSFLCHAMQAIRDLAADTADGGPALLVSGPWREDDSAVYNAVFLLEGGTIAACRYKHNLPNYGVFDEKRVFVAGPLPEPILFRGVKLGVPICEDIWTSRVTDALAAAGAEILLAPNGSPYEVDKFDVRRSLAAARVAETGAPLVYLNQIGGQDELVFDGASFVVNAQGDVPVQMAAWREQILVTHWRREADGRWACRPEPHVEQPSHLAGIYGAMMIGLRDYVRKSRFRGVLLGMSGGIDSALSAAVAVDALGAECVRCVMMPSRYTSSESLEDASACARKLGARIDEIAINPGVEALTGMLAPLFAAESAGAGDVTEENLQSRLRGVTLMALSNKFGFMVLTTGNKSEMATGYATLYGDMCGGYSVLKDIYKTTVFALSRWRNLHQPETGLGPSGLVIPERIITKPPTAELRPGQTDEASLMPYAQLDPILERLVDFELPIGEIVAEGWSREATLRVQNLLYGAEYKRRQAPPGVKITRKNFGRDRRYPIVNGFRE